MTNRVFYVILEVIEGLWSVIEWEWGDVVRTAL